MICMIPGYSVAEVEEGFRRMAEALRAFGTPVADLHTPCLPALMAFGNALYSHSRH